LSQPTLDLARIEWRASGKEGPAHARKKTREGRWVGGVWLLPSRTFVYAILGVCLSTDLFGNLCFFGRSGSSDQLLVGLVERFAS
jgi:hypothetical protein